MRVLSSVVVAGLFLASLSAPAAGADARRRLGEAEGEFRPVAVAALLDVTLAGGFGAAGRGYLGLEEGAPFRVGAVRGELVVVEMFNASCYACTLMAPVMDEAWRRVDARADLKERVRFVGIGIGNSVEQVREFHGRYDTPFPMIADPEFAAFDALGTVEGTPYLLLLRRGAGGGVTAVGQVGYIPDAGRVVAAIEAALAGAPGGDGTPRELAGAGWRTLQPPLSGAELEARLVGAAVEAGLAGAAPTRVPLEGGEVFYRLSGGGRSLWALVAGRAKVCNVCHDIFFIVVFDDAGKVVGLTPITITKYKNVELDAADVAFLRSRVVGRQLSPQILFDPAVDAVSTATMSSSLVFDTLRRLGESWGRMVSAGKALP